MTHFVCEHIAGDGKKIIQFCLFFPNEILSEVFQILVLFKVLAEFFFFKQMNFRGTERPR